MKPIKNYFFDFSRLHYVWLRKLYLKILLLTDGINFVFLFILNSSVHRRGVKVIWKKPYFIVTDKKFPGLKYQFRHQNQGNMAYRRGFQKRADSLAECYFLNFIDFKEGDIVIDCGANTGDLLLYFKLKSLNINYIAFEPSPIEFECLRENIKPHKAYNVGLWDQEGMMPFYLSSQDADSSLIETKKYDEAINIKTIRLDSIIDSEVKCLKLEAEGGEPEVLKGLGQKLKLVHYICADVAFERGKEAYSTLAPVTNILLKNGFELVAINHKRISAFYRNTELTKNNNFEIPKKKALEFMI